MNGGCGKIEAMYVFMSYFDIVFYTIKKFGKRKCCSDYTNSETARYLA